MQCCYVEPWVGRCAEECVPDSICCKKHSEQKCSVCGDQATTCCEASIGLMCGVPLCDLCGHGEMCLHHATRGPLAMIRGLLGGGPVLSVFGTHEVYEKEQAELDAQVARLRERKFHRYESQLQSSTQ